MSRRPFQPIAGAESLRRLLVGNLRYINNKATDANEGAQRRSEVAQVQDPFAIVFGCVDSRVPPEIIFDCGLGDLFVIRTAGQVIDQAVLTSIEFGVLELGIPLIMVLGHERCGAVKAAVEAVEAHADGADQFNWLVKHIRPAVHKAKEMRGDLLNNAIRANIQLTVQALRDAPVLAPVRDKGQLRIVGAYYDLDSGRVMLTPLPEAW